MGILFDLVTEGFDPISVIDSVSFNELYAEAVDTLKEFEAMIASFTEKTENIEVDIFNEAVEKPGFEKVLKRSGEQIGVAHKSYDDVTQGAGDAIHHSTMLGLKVISWISKAVSLICKFIGWFPKAINALLRKIGKISGKAWHKITGKFDMNITLDDLKYFEHKLIPQIDEFVMHCEAFADRNRKWKDGVVNKVKKNIMLEDTDFKRFNEMVRIMGKISTVNINPSALPLKSDFVRDTYFNTESEYYKSLQKFNDYFVSKRSVLEKLKKDVAEKRLDSQSDGAYFQLSPVHRAKVDHAERMIGQFLNVILKFYKAIQEDINTIAKLSAKAKNVKIDDEGSSEDMDYGFSSTLDISYLKSWFTEHLPDGAKGVIFIPSDKETKKLKLGTYPKSDGRKCILQGIYDDKNDKLVRHRKVEYKTLDPKLEKVLKDNNGSFIVEK